MLLLMDQQSKLIKFQNAVFSEIEVQIASMREEAENYESSELTKNADYQLLRSYNKIQTQVQDIRKTMKREVAKHSLIEKRTILAKRQELMGNVFSAVEARLSSYIKTEDYKKALLKKISAASKEMPIENPQIIVGEVDFSAEKAIKKAYGLPCELVLDKTITLGGYILKASDKALYFDETLKSRLDGQKTYFIENSGLTM